MRHAWIGWTAVALVLGGMTAAIAEDLTLSTYYPSPRGVYEELHTSGNAFFATQHGRVGIGTTSPSATLEVNGSLRLAPGTAAGAKPMCDSSRRGTLWFSQDVPTRDGPVDRLELCAHVYDMYQWVVVLGGSP